MLEAGYAPATRAGLRVLPSPTRLNWRIWSILLEKIHEKYARPHWSGRLHRGRRASDPARRPCSLESGCRPALQGSCDESIWGIAAPCHHIDYL